MDKSAFLSDKILQLKGGYLDGDDSAPSYDIDFNQTQDIPYGRQLPTSFKPFATLKSNLREISPSPSKPPEESTRESPAGVVQKGLDLGRINSLFKSQSDKGMMTAGELSNSSKYLSAALPTTEVGELQLEKPLVEGASPTQKPDVSSDDEPSLPYGTKLPEGTKPFASTTPYKTGGTPSEPQDGTSPKPDRVERLRQVAFNGADFSGDEPDDSTLVSPMYANKERNAARAAFLDPNNKGYNAIRARDRAVGAFHQYDTGGVMIDGEIQEFNKGMSRDARFELSGGLNSAEQAQKFKDKYLKSVVADTGETGSTPTSTETPVVTTEVETPAPTDSTFKPAWKTTPVPDSGAPAGGWDKHFADMEKNR